MKSVQLSPEKMRLLQEFIWRAMGRLDGTESRDLLDSSTPLGHAVREYYAALADGKQWEELIEFQSPVGSDLLPEHLRNSPADKPWNP
jgi:hypothetical protein